jgi:branched-chain amino acid transport system substrate-binding protein
MGPIKLDDYGKPVLNIYIRKVERKDGQLVNTTIDTVRDVTQFWTYDPKQFISGPQYGRDVPASKFLE